MVANIVIEVRDVDYRFYHTDFRISNRHLTLFRIGRIADHQKQETEEIGERGTHLVGGAFDIVGVEIVNISPYQLSVGISQAVAWGPVEKQLFDLFERVFEIEDLRIHEAPLSSTVVTLPHKNPLQKAASFFHGILSSRRSGRAQETEEDVFAPGEEPEEVLDKR